MASEQDPLLQQTQNEGEVLYRGSPEATVKVGRRIEDDVLPETATVGRRIGWVSAYILVISRVIGSGIFAMPGPVVQTVGSPGLL